MEQAVWRPRIKIAAWGATLLSLVSFWYGYSSGSYISVVFGTFLFVFGVSHLIYAGWEPFPILAVRLIDYVYVGFGAGAAFLAIQGQHEREIYLRALSQAETNIHAMFLPVSPTPEGLETYVTSAINFFCVSGDPLVISTTGDFCEWAKGVQRFLANSFSLSDLASEVTRSQDIASKKGWAGMLFCRPRRAIVSRPDTDRLGEFPQLRMDPFMEAFDVPPLKQYSDLLCSSSGRANEIIDVLQVMLDNKKLAMPLLPQPPDSTTFGVFKTVIWPFFLAIAIALRLTKVTADVTAWAR